MTKTAMNKRRGLSEMELVNRCLYLLEKRVSNSILFKKFIQVEIITCLHEIKVSWKNGGNPKFSVKMLLRYCSGFPLLMGLAKKISTFNEQRPLAV